MPSLELEGEPFVIDPEAVKHRCVQIMNVHRILHNVVAVVVGFPVSDAALDSSARQPDREAAWVVVATIVLFR